MNRTAAIITAMRANLTATAAAENDPEFVAAQDAARRVTVRRIQSGVNVSGERYSLATAKGRRDAILTAAILTAGCGEGNRNAAKRDASLPKRALSMASSRGRVTPDMAASLLAFFQNPGSLAHTLLCSFLPTKVSNADATALLTDPFVVDVIEGLGRRVPTASEAVKLVKNPATNVNPGYSASARRVSIADGVTAPTVDAKRRGRPSGPKYVAHLPFAATANAAALLLTGPRPVFGPSYTHGIPSGNDYGQGNGPGYGLEVHSDGCQAWMGRYPTPAQVARKAQALDASTHGYRSIDGVIVERW